MTSYAGENSICPHVKQQPHVSFPLTDPVKLPAASKNQYPHAECRQQMAEIIYSALEFMFKLEKGEG